MSDALPRLAWTHRPVLFVAGSGPTLASGPSEPNPLPLATTRRPVRTSTASELGYQPVGTRPINLAPLHRCGPSRNNAIAFARPRLTTRCPSWTASALGDDPSSAPGNGST